MKNIRRSFLRKSNNKRNLSAGFTLIEFILMIAFLAIVASSLSYLLQNQYLGTLDSNTELIETALSDAQLRSIDAVQGTGWGIHFDNTVSSTPLYSLFPGSSYASASTTYYVSKNIRFCYPSAGNSLDIAFKKNNGKNTTNSRQALTIELNSDDSHSNQKLITVSAQGTITISDTTSSACSGVAP